MSKRTYFPGRGDLVHLNFSPAAEHEMADYHYGLVLSSLSFSKSTGFAMICPITSRIRNWPFEVRIGKGILPSKGGAEIESVILTDQAKSMDFRDRGITFVGTTPEDILDEALAKVRAIIDSDDPESEVTA